MARELDLVSVEWDRHGAGRGLEMSDSRGIQNETPTSERQMSSVN